MNTTQLFHRLAAAATLAGLCLALIGCSKVNSENYGKLKIGMDYGEVVALLGDPGQCDALVAFKRCTWGKEGKSITVQMVADKVALFESSGL